MASTRKQMTTNTVEDVEKEELLLLAVGMRSCVATVQVRMETNQKTKNRATIWPGHATPGYTLEEPTL